MADYWKDPSWIQKAVQAELSVQPLLSQRRWTDKDIIAANSVYWPEWPLIPKGIGADFEGERSLRVFIEVRTPPTATHPYGRLIQAAPSEAVLIAKISLRDAVRAGLVASGSWTTCLVVPVKFFVWVGGALSFDKKVLLSLSQLIMERSLTHKDAEIWPELVWITPMKTDDRKYYYSVLPLVGMGGVIDPRKGNPGLYAPIQPDPYRNIVWQVVDEIVDGGTSVWGTDAASGDGAASIFASKLRLVNFLRDLADKFQEEEFEWMIERGEFDRGAVHKVCDEFGSHLPDDQRRALIAKWLERADAVEKPRIVRAALAGRVYGFGSAASAILKGFGEGWAADLQVEADRLVQLALLCTRFNYFAKKARGRGLNKDGGWFAELAEEGYIKGELLLEDAEEIDEGHELNLPTSDEEKKLYDEELRDIVDQLSYLAGPRFPH